ncbi:MAG: redoxin domain-containing protein [Oligoflexia bacterium]|nr:redoxin domain-containing protein [Oligoflexia bacterium]
MPPKSAPADPFLRYLASLLCAILAASCALTALTLSAAATPSAAQARWGWTEGTVAAQTDATLTPNEPIQVSLPEAVAKHVKGPTAILYFSPVCPHCRRAMPELNALARLQPDLAWLGVATSSATEQDLAEFESTFDVQFDVVVDRDRAFAQATGARSTPSLLLAQPAPKGATPTSGDPVAKGMAVVTVTDAFMPYIRGMTPIIAMRRNASGTRVDEDGQPLPADPWRDFNGYQGVRACAACHTAEATSWAITHHAGAFVSLYRQDRADDLACVGCHVVGFNQGGFIPGDTTSPHTDVGCESCHGPAGPHDGDPAATASGGDSTDACVGCHDVEHSVNFTLAKAMPLIDHFAAVGMDEDTLRARLDALATGTAARPLLAFKDGPTVGSAACKSCHKTEYRAWSKYSHAQAMDLLTGDDATNPACASCHATPTAFQSLAAGGKAAATMETLRTDEGVGCESCHGPGTDHIAAPGIDNIMRLGSTCPECVLEGICTSCHVPKWDPKWSLHQRLDALPYKSAPQKPAP